jgi:hypothetical protein
MTDPNMAKKIFIVTYNMPSKMMEAAEVGRDVDVLRDDSYSISVL